MTTSHTDIPGDTWVYDPATQPELFADVHAKRIVAFCIDAVLVVLLLIPAGIMVAILGFVTLGLAWLLIPSLLIIVALAYVALTLGTGSATPGMRLTGVAMRTWSGRKAFPVLAIMHAVLFWFSVTVLTPFILLVGLFTHRRQLLHDMLLGVVVLNAEALRRHERGR